MRNAYLVKSSGLSPSHPHALALRPSPDADSASSRMAGTPYRVRRRLDFDPNLRKADM